MNKHCYVLFPELLKVAHLAVSRILLQTGFYFGRPRFAFNARAVMFRFALDRHATLESPSSLYYHHYYIIIVVVVDVVVVVVVVNVVVVVVVVVVLFSLLLLSLLLLFL